MATELRVRISKGFLTFDPEPLAPASPVAVLENVANGRLDVKLDDEDHARLAPVLEKSQDLLHRIGDCGDEYR